MADLVEFCTDEEDYDDKTRTYRPILDAFAEFDDVEFRKRFRLSKDAANELCTLLEADLRRVSRRRCTISAQTQILIALRYYGGGSFQLLTGDSIGVSQPSVSKAISAVSMAICNRIGDFIKMPMGAEATRRKRAFFDVAGLRDVISCIDCSHIRITKPHVNEEQFINRKSYHSLNVQFACDDKYTFTDVFVKWPGGSHDAFILRDSALWTTFENDPSIGIVLGDSGYPCRYWLMTPYLSPQLESDRLYNQAHRKTRVRIEQAIGQLKRRFNLLHQENRRALNNVVFDVAACTALHNFAKDRNDPDDFDDLSENEDRDDYEAGDARPQGARDAGPGLERRRMIANSLMRQ